MINSHQSLLVVLLSAGLIGASSSTLAAGSETPAIITQIEQGASATNDMELPILLVAPVETTLVSPMLGRVESMTLEMGQSFKKGDELISFVCDDRNAQYAIGRAELSAAQINHENKLKLQGLAQAGEIEVVLAANEVSRAQAQLAYHRALRDQCVIKAPFDGRLANISVKPFQGVSQGEPVLEIISSGSTNLRLNAPASWLQWINIGTAFEVWVEEVGGSYNAEISAINSRVDNVSRTIEVEATISGAGAELLPGMSGFARFNQPR
ncbi:MAG: HlyD family efflux transporter periplasmic adaptor subunit [Oceanospirillaceae bacterium]|nr:HlyD family efflux transporter periplasmic adaptor subunit [Oceanospirillaceae bacterium]